jgi:hypothetical protein
MVRSQVMDQLCPDFAVNDSIMPLDCLRKFSSQSIKAGLLEEDRKPWRCAKYDFFFFATLSFCGVSAEHEEMFVGLAD